jgi:hypothetical protein
MSDNDRFVSPYLLRPLRNLDQVPAAAAERSNPRPTGVKMGHGRRWIESIDPSRSRQAAELPPSDLHP